jgi:hypothetical protein
MTPSILFHAPVRSGGPLHMSNEHFINLEGVKLNRHIYRIIPQRRFFELFRTHEQSLARPASWPDPFENFIRNSTAHYP